MQATPESAYPASTSPEDAAPETPADTTPSTAAAASVTDDPPSQDDARLEQTVGGVLCPYCGAISGASDRCTECAGLFEPLSRQATQNAMGPWQVRRTESPFAPPCSFETLAKMVARGKVTPDSVVRGPTTRQFWQRARRIPGLATLFGLCHSCGAGVGANDAVCSACGAALTLAHDRNHLGLRRITPLPGEDPPAVQTVDAASHPPSPTPNPTPTTSDAPPEPRQSVTVARASAARWRRAAVLLTVALVVVTVIGIGLAAALISGG
ncbi:MAG: hypothetical protein AAGI30_13660 [Planctomycetota bacterium]